MNKKKKKNKTKPNKTKTKINRKRKLDDGSCVGTKKDEMPAMNYNKQTMENHWAEIQMEDPAM